MSRVGKKPIPIPNGVQVEIKGSVVRAKGPLGELREILPEGVNAELKESVVVVSSRGGDGRANAIYGTSRARVANIIQGVSEGFTKMLEIYGLGYRASVQGEKMVLSLGYSHPVEFLVPKEIKVKVEPKQNTITISGINKELVGSTAGRLRALKPPEPYKGTGIRYRGEHILRKAGKTAAGTGVAKR